MRTQSAAPSLGESRAPARAIARLATIALCALLAVAALAGARKAFGPHTSYAPDFTLVDQDGRAFTLSTLRGNPVVLFFGYTHCPDTCPLTLAHLARAVHDKNAPDGVRVAFITVDPYRDSPAVMKRYVRLFDPAFIGLTGTLKSLDPVYSDYHTWRQAVPVRHGPTDYSMAHGATVYYIGRDGSLKGLGDWTDSVAQITHDMRSFQ
jgi:protein SCO1/2